ncbi:MAG: dimethylsulfoniopropionate demethylase [Geminicoccaceae bacterium]
MTDGLNMSRRIRRTPFTDRVEAAGVRGFSVVNHMLLPKAFERSVEEDYWHLRKCVQIWDVSCQRQVQIEGPDAARLVQWMTPRDISKSRPGQCLYVPIVDTDGGMINDPILLRLDHDKFWLSIADSDVLLFAKGLTIGAGLNAYISEPDVSPLAVQGPKAEDVVAEIFGEDIRKLGFFRFNWFDFQGTQQLIARSGYSRQGGFEIYLDDGALGGTLWDAVWEAGQLYDIAPGCPNLIERIEGGLLSYGNEMTQDNNPLEIGLGRYCALDGSVDYIGRKALQAIASQGITREIRGVLFDGGPCPTCSTPWPVVANGENVGLITSAIWSPRLSQNVGLALIDRDFWASGQPVSVQAGDGAIRLGEISALPFR